GALPVVTDVGGLHDTVEPIRSEPNLHDGVEPFADSGTGFVAPRVSVGAIHDVCLDALRMYQDRPARERAMVRAMVRSTRFGWDTSAAKYRALYEELLVER